MADKKKGAWDIVTVAIILGVLFLVIAVALIVIFSDGGAAAIEKIKSLLRLSRGGA